MLGQDNKTHDKKFAITHEQELNPIGPPVVVQSGEVFSLPA